MTDAEPTRNAPVPVVDPEPRRRALVAGILQRHADLPRAAFSTTARDVPEGAYGVGAVSLGSDDPISEARFLASRRGCRGIVFYGSAEERQRWASRISYEPMLPRHRVVVALEEGDSLSRALHQAHASLKGRAAVAPVLRRVDEQASGLRSALESVILDALRLEGGLRDAYAAVLRGSLAGLEDSRGDAHHAHARRALQSALRRVELLRGAEERDRVASEVGALFARLAEGSMLAAEFGVRDAAALGAAIEHLRDLGREAGLDPRALDSLEQGAASVAGASLARGVRGVFLARYAPGRGHVSVEWRDGDGRVIRLVVERDDARSDE